MFLATIKLSCESISKPRALKRILKRALNMSRNVPTRSSERMKGEKKKRVMEGKLYIPEPVDSSILIPLVGVNVTLCAA